MKNIVVQKVVVVSMQIDKNEEKIHYQMQMQMQMQIQMEMEMQI